MSDKVLLVDDDPSVRESLSRALRSENYCVIPAENGADALHLSRTDGIAVVLLDLNPPTSIGWSVLKQMMAAHPRLPVIIITAQSNLHEAAAQAGAVAILEKPLSLPMLLSLMKRVIRPAVDPDQSTMQTQTTQPAASVPANQ